MTGGDSMRLDKWLWAARLARTRSAAARLCGSGAVAIGATAAPKPHHPVRAGDVVTLVHGRVRRRLVVLALAARRGPAAVARSLYHEPEPPAPIPAPAESWTPLFDEAAEG